MTNRHGILLPALLCSGLLLPITSAQSRPVRILPLGDSITQGGRADREEYTYRLPLAHLLADAGAAFDFIGSLTNGLNPQAAWPEHKGVPFDRDHEGHYGWKTAAVRDHLAEWMPKWGGAPDIVLVHLGTNDQSPEDYDATIVQPLKAIIGMLREQNPQVVVLVGHLNFNGGAALKIRPLVETMAAELSTPTSPVATVHHYKGWHERPEDPETDTFDWAHPNPQGQRKMAQNWFDAMRPYLMSER
jgi:lysophospholipase L1-like esterase